VARPVLVASVSLHAILHVAKPGMVQKLGQSLLP
jgi:hypothetical protein